MKILQIITWFLSLKYVLGLCKTEDGTYVKSNSPEVTGCYNFIAYEDNGFPIFEKGDNAGIVPIALNKDDAIWALVSDEFLCYTDAYPKGNPGYGSGIHIEWCSKGIDIQANFYCGCGWGDESQPFIETYILSNH